MTDKRFTRKEYAIYEKGNPICMTLRNVDKRLNELWEENEELKEENEELKNICKNLINEINKRGITVTMTDSYRELLE